MMTRFALFLLLTPALFAQPDIQLGSEIYGKNCANQYYHGANGEAGPAPALAGRGMRYRNIARPVIYGVSNTNMPPWKDTLSQEELDAVIEYVLSLQGPAKISAAKTHPEQQQAALDHPGRDLFFDPGRPGACGSCHEFAGLGVAVGPPIESVPASIAALRDARASRVQSVIPASGRPFQGLAIPERSEGLRFYDLGPTLPVLRTFTKDGAAVKAQSDWTHAARTDLYTEAELGAILEYISAELDRP